MKRRRQQTIWIFGTVAMAGFLLVLFLPRPHIPEISFKPVPDRDVPAATATEARPLSSESKESLVAAPTLASFQQALQKCQFAIDGFPAATPEQWLQILENEVGVHSQQKLIENYHLQISGEGERRLQLIYYPEDPSKPTELRYFQLDAEGYPEPLKISDSLRWNPSPQQIESFLTKGEVLRHEYKSQWILKDSNRIQLEFHNGQLFEFQFSKEGKSLACRENICSCIH